VPDKTIDELLEAIEAVQILKEALGKHEQLFAKIADKLERLEERLGMLEAAQSGPSLEWVRTRQLAGGRQADRRGRPASPRY
jgi:hypothetical protein